MGKWGSAKDVGKHTGVSSREAARAGHDARDDMASSGFLSERNESKTSDSPEGGILSRIFSGLGFGADKDDDGTKGL